MRRVMIMWLLALLAIPAVSRARGQEEPPRVALAYVWQNAVTLADPAGNVVNQPGPTFAYGQGARLFWTPDADLLYIARDDGLYVASAGGGPAVQVPGQYGRTLAIAQDVETLYYVETASPQPVDANVENGPVTYPLREVTMALMDGSTGRLAGYFGQFQPGAAQASITFAAALYARDGGLLGPGRPNIWPTYGTNIFGTCCFPDPGLGVIDASTGNFAIYRSGLHPRRSSGQPDAYPPRRADDGRRAACDRPDHGRHARLCDRYRGRAGHHRARRVVPG